MLSLALFAAPALPSFTFESAADDVADHEPACHLTEDECEERDAE